MKKIVMSVAGLTVALSGCSSATAVSEDVTSAGVVSEVATSETVASEAATTDQEQQETSYDFIWPEENGTIGATFGSYENHVGLDIQSGEGTDVLAAADGTVVDSGYDEQGNGNYITLEHEDGYQTVYAHLQAIPDLEIGDTVSQGDVIAKEGATGNVTESLLHFEVIENGENIDPQTVLPE